MTETLAPLLIGGLLLVLGGVGTKSLHQLASAMAPHDQPRRTMRRSTSALLLAGCIAALSGCASVHSRSEVLSFGATDGTWTMGVLMLITNNRCGLGFTKSTLSNHGRTPIGGTFIVTVENTLKTSVLRELTVHCQIAVPGGSASCSDSAQSFVFPCESIHLSARPAVGR